MIKRKNLRNGEKKELLSTVIILMDIPEGNRLKSIRHKISLNWQLQDSHITKSVEEKYQNRYQNAKDGPGGSKRRHVTGRAIKANSSWKFSWLGTKTTCQKSDMELMVLFHMSFIPISYFPRLWMLLSSLHVAYNWM